jgi:Dyp-type peroxidase family
MDLSDIQGLVFYGYRSQPLARYYFATFGDEAEPRAWLSRVFARVSSAHKRERDEATRFNVAFTASGLSRLGLGEQTLFEFPREFTQGMSHPERSIALGDYGEDAPETWEIGGPRGPRLDALVMLFCRDEAELGASHEELTSKLETYGISAQYLDAYLPGDGKEHFGFTDAITNPVVKGGPVKHDKNPFDPRIRAGEILLGYKNGYGRYPSSPTVPPKRSTRELPPRTKGGSALDFGHNGSYLVFRKLEQDVEKFWRYAEERAELAGVTDRKAYAEAFAARLVGRWPDGRPLAVAPGPDDPADDLNRFGYRDEDLRGLRCPVGAHIRRTNPRDALGDDGAISLQRASRHRIMRRGRLYAEPGPAGTSRKGLAFLALNANLRRQFEFIQQTWLNNPKFGGLTHDRDPLVGRAGTDLTGDPEPRVFTRASTPFRERVIGLPSFVRVRGGGYFFLPSLRALGYLAED